jgi:hypothetical protein
VAAGRLAVDLRWKPEIVAARLNGATELHPRPTFRATYKSSCAGPASRDVSW